MLIDTHCHLTDSRLASDLSGVVSRATQAGVERLLCVATTAETSEECTRIAMNDSRIYASVGMHPTYCHEEKPGDWEQILSLVNHERVVALGETGLDLYWKECPLDVQQRSFERHWELSRQTGLPLIIHMRDCEAEMLTAIEEEAKRGPIRAVLHSFAGSLETALRLLDLGLYLSFAGMVTYKKSDDLRRIIPRVPEDRILVETDSPYLSPEPFRSKRPNEPALVVHTAKCVAQERAVSLEQIAKITSANALRLFSKMR